MDNVTQPILAFLRRLAPQLRTRRAAFAGICAAVGLSWLAILWRPSAPAQPDTTTPTAAAAPESEPASPPPAGPSQLPSGALEPSAPARRPPPDVEPGAQPPRTRYTAPPAPARAPADTSPEALASALASENPGVRVAALREVRKRGDASALPQLIALDPGVDPDAAPTLISTVATLARNAEPAQRTAASDRMRVWLHAELERAPQNTDARGNLANLVEALGSVPGAEASGALVEALDSQKLPVHMATVAVQGLARQGDAQSREAVQRFRDRLAEAPAAEGFQRELNEEAAQAADQALARLGH